MIGININHPAHRRAARVERVALKQDVHDRRDPGFKGQRIVRLDIKMAIGMHAPGDIERLAATDLHVAGRKHGELENRDARQLQFLQHPRLDVLRTRGVGGMGNHRVSRDITLEAGVSGIQHHIADARRAIHIGVAGVAERIVKFPVAPVGGIRRGRHGVLAVGVQVVGHELFPAVEKIPRNLADDFFRGGLGGGHGARVLDGAMRQPRARRGPRHHARQNRQRDGAHDHHQDQGAACPASGLRCKWGLHSHCNARRVTEVSSL